MPILPKNIISDIQYIKKNLTNLPIHWDGKECILELKEADYNWRQMEWWAFYFEFECARLLPQFTAGDKNGSTKFDLKGSINWDCKAKALKSDEHVVILNDVESMKKSIAEHGYHGEIIALCDVEYNDVDRSFQKWHSVLKGGLSDYEQARRKRTHNSRYRKTSAKLTEIVLVIITEDDLEKLDIMKQGRNSNGQPRPTKYKLNLEMLEEFEHDTMDFEK